jgi:hypothetical protein
MAWATRCENMKLLDYKEKQKILYVDQTPARDLIAYGDQYLEANRIADAAEFYQRAGHAPGLEKIRNIALDSGDVMMFQQVMKALNRKVSDGEWNDIGDKALDRKKYTFALAAFEKSANTAMLQKVDTMLKSGDVK